MSIEEFTHGLESPQDSLLTAVAELRRDENVASILELNDSFEPWSQW